jgi:hypothetical protein
MPKSSKLMQQTYLLTKFRHNSYDYQNTEKDVGQMQYGSFVEKKSTK